MHAVYHNANTTLHVGLTPCIWWLYVFRPGYILFRRQTRRPICEHFVLSANWTTNLQTSATRRPIWRLFVHPAERLRCWAYCPIILGTSCPFCNFICCFLSSFFSVPQVFFVGRWQPGKLFEQYCERFGGPKSKVINRQKMLDLHRTSGGCMHRGHGHGATNSSKPYVHNDCHVLAGPSCVHHNSLPGD